MATNNNENIYFALKPAEETAAIVLGRATDFYKRITANQYVEKINKMWRFYHGYFMEGQGLDHEVNFVGEQGELVHLPVNHFRNLARHIFVMITSNRPIMEARAVNTDYKSLSQAYLATGILEYYMREKGLESCIKKAAEYAIVLGAGFIKLSWNATAGELYDVDETTGEFNYEGDLEFTNLTPLDVIVDGMKESWDNDWICVRTFKNKYDLAAKYPEFAEKLIKMETKSDVSMYRIGLMSNDETDDIAVYEFYHRPTESMPEGRYMYFCSEDTIMIDTKMPYKQIPIFRITPSDILGTPYGYTPMFDIFPIQEAINSTISAIMTNQNAFAVQSLFVKSGSDFAINMSGEGMTIYEGSEPPIPLQLTSTPEETFKFLDTLVAQAETISGVNSVARGNPEASLKSGTALALVQSMAIQFMSELQQSYVKLIEDTGSGVIQILQDFATAPRVAAIVGKNNRTEMKEFKSDDLSSVKRVFVDVGNALSRTMAGRVQMADQLLQMKLLQSPEQYFSVLNTGKLEMMYEGDMKQLLLIKKENEWFLDGKSPIVVPTDAHALHIKEHSAVLGDPELREDPNLARIVMDHVQAHMDALQNTDPRLLQLVGQQPLPPLGPPMDPNAAPPAAPGQEGPIKGGSIQNPQGQNLPNLPQVDPSLLPNPELQEQSLGNVSGGEGQG